MRTRIPFLAAVLILSACSGSETRLEKKAARIHEAVYTVDSHTDTPMLLNRDGFVFEERHDPRETRSKIDLPRMKEGGMDGIWFGVFTGQGPRTPEGNQNAYEEANGIIRDIYETVDTYSEDLEVATRADDLKRIADKGKHAIYLGMENGYPLGDNPDLLNEFYGKGIRYVTLVHSSNNGICDSSTDTLKY